MNNLPTREEHARHIRSIFYKCGLGALFCFLFMSSIAVGMRAVGHTSREIVDVMLIIVYIFIPLYLFGYVAPTLAVSLIKMSLGIEMSRQTVDDFRDVRDDIKPLVRDVKAVVSEIRPMVDDAVKAIKEGNGHLNGQISHVVKKVLEEARSAAKDAESDLERIVWAKVDKFLASVFEGKQDMPQEPLGAPGDSTETVRSENDAPHV